MTSVTVDAVAEGRRFQNALRKFLVFSLVGCGATAVHYAVLFLLVHWMALGAVFSSSIGVCCGAIVSYILNYNVTFCATSGHRHALPRFVAMVIVGFFLNFIFMYFFVNFVMLYYMVAQVMTTLLVLALNFFISAKFIFMWGNNDA